MDPPHTDIDPTAGNQSLMFATRSNETEDLWSLLPDDVAVKCLAQVSRLDMVALAMVSRRHRFVPESHRIRALRYGIGSVEPYLYVFMHMYPDPSPRWFVLHPVQRRLKPVHSSIYPAPGAGSCFVATDWGIYTIGGLINGKPTSQVTFFDCIKHTLYRVKPMKMARSGASASLIDKKKIYVFGGCWDVADSSNYWVEVFDMETGTWDFLSVFTPKMPLKIQQSVVLPRNDENPDHVFVYAVDEDGQIFAFSPSVCMFMATGITESNPETRNDWFLGDALFCRGVGGRILWHDWFLGDALFCRGVGGRILWRFHRETVWKEVNGLEELQQQHSGFDIIKLCAASLERMAIFWEAHGPDQILELWYAELSLTRRQGAEGCWEVWANVEWSAAVLSDSSHTGLNLLCAASLYA